MVTFVIKPNRDQISPGFIRFLLMLCGPSNEPGPTGSGLGPIQLNLDVSSLRCSPLWARRCRWCRSAWSGCLFWRCRGWWRRSGTAAGHSANRGSRVRRRPKISGSCLRPRISRTRVSGRRIRTWPSSRPGWPGRRCRRPGFVSSPRDDSTPVKILLV